MNPKAAYLALNGFVVCTHSHSPGYRIKRNEKDGEPRLGISPQSSHWIVGPAAVKPAYTVIPWDQLPEEYLGLLSWKHINAFIASTQEEA